MNIMTVILGIIDKVLGLFKSKEERRIIEEKKKNEEPFVKAAKKQREVERIDSHEKLVRDVSDPDKKQNSLEEIRKRLGR